MYSTIVVKGRAGIGAQHLARCYISIILQFHNLMMISDICSGYSIVEEQVCIAGCSISHLSNAVEKGRAGLHSRYWGIASSKVLHQYYITISQSYDDI